MRPDRADISGPWAFVRVFRAPRSAGLPGTCEDAHHPPADEDVTDDIVTLAVADGSSGSVLAGRWARVLATAAGEADPRVLGSPAGFADMVVETARTWPAELAAHRAEREAAGRPVQWYERPGLDRGAYATLVAAAFARHPYGGDAGMWRAAALGDACLFQVRDDRLVTAFPLLDPVRFGTTPVRAHSFTRDVLRVVRDVEVTGGDWLAGDRFVLASDTFACWFLAQAHAGRAPWRLVELLGTDVLPDFAAWVEEQRNRGVMRDADVTVVRLQVR